MISDEQKGSNGKNKQNEHSGQNKVNRDAGCKAHRCCLYTEYICTAPK